MPNYPSSFKGTEVDTLLETVETKVEPVKALLTNLLGVTGPIQQQLDEKQALGSYADKTAENTFAEINTFSEQSKCVKGMIVGNAVPATPAANYAAIYNDGTHLKYKNPAGAIHTLRNSSVVCVKKNIQLAKLVADGGDLAVIEPGPVYKYVINGDHVSKFTTGDKIVGGMWVNAANNGEHTVVTSVLSGGNTHITVVEALTAEVASGDEVIVYKPAGADYFFKKADASVTETTIAFTNILPANCRLLDVVIVAHSLQDYHALPVHGSFKMKFDIGMTSGSSEVMSAVETNPGLGVGVIDTVGSDESFPHAVPLSNTARTLYVSGTPDQNWNELSNGNWDIYFMYLDYNIIISGGMTI